MIKSAVTIALVPQLKTGPWIFWENLEISISKARQLGFDGVELFTPSASAVDPVKLQEILKSAELGLAAVGTGAGKVLHGLTLTDPDEHIRKRAISYSSEMITFGARFGAPAIIGSMQGNTVAGVERERSIAWLADGLTALAKHAQKEGVQLIYEPLNRYETNLLNTLPDAAAFVNTLNVGNIVLLADLFHMNIEEQSLPGSIRNAGRLIGHVHFADSNRRPVGMGHTSIGPIAAALKDIGYNGYISAEAFPLPTPDAAAKQTIQSFRKFFRSTA